MSVIDLSRQASDERLAEDKEAKQRERLVEAAGWARGMNRTFKGIRGGLSRRGYAIQAIKRFDLDA